MSKRPLLLGTISIVLVVGGYFFIPHEKPEISSIEPAYPVPLKIKKSIVLPTEANRPKILAKKKPSSTLAQDNQREDYSPQVREIKKCYPSVVLKSNRPIEDAFEQLSEGKDYKEIIDFKNYHFTLSNGEQRRLQIRLDEDTKGNEYKVLKLFKVDKEGLPDPIEIDPKIAKNPTEEIIDQYLREGSVHFTQDIGNRFFSDKDYISFIKENGDLQNLEVYRDNKVLRCNVDAHEQLNCKCSD